MKQKDNPPSAQKDKNQLSELDVNLEEYRNLSDQISKRVDFQQKLLNYQILLVGIIITAGVSLLSLDYTSSNTISVRYFLLLSPLPFYFLSWSFSNHDIMIVALARYINIDLRPRIKRLIGGKDVLRVEDFLLKERKQRSEEFGILPTLGEEYLLPLVFPAILITLYIFTFLYNIDKKEIDIDWPQFILLIIDVVLHILTIKLKKKAGRNYLRILEDNSE
ncbi:hypothetical protein C5S53_15895 [Methanophagales archaeon]|nr:hypothetical protein C5S53_15895 [Methanophagales archaeon]